jgi:uncharacterized pyridoxamine 5'-phosphate oxidase family protein
MSKVVDFLNSSKVFYLATVDGDKARVRPINSVIEYNGKIYFETSSQKDMYRQMLINPNVAISGMADSKWIRVTGKAVMDENPEAVQAMFDAIPALKDVYSREEFKVYYLEEMKAVVYSFQSEPEELEN